MISRDNCILRLALDSQLLAGAGCSRMRKLRDLFNPVSQVLINGLQKRFNSDILDDRSSKGYPNAQRWMLWGREQQKQGGVTLCNLAIYLKRRIMKTQTLHHAKI
jgi:hypothetical protein